MLIVVPHKENVTPTFGGHCTLDYYRNTTSISHLKEDMTKDIGEDDLTHIHELIEIAESQEDNQQIINNIRKLYENNYNYRCIHHHAFNTRLSIEMIDYIKMQIIDLNIKLPYHIIILAQKKSKVMVDNSNYLDKSASWIRRSPFSFDKND